MMLNATQKNYPVPLFMDRHLPRWVNTAKEENELTALGWNPDSRNIPLQEYPKAMYDARGGVVPAGGFDKNGFCDWDAAKAEEKRLLKAGHTHVRPAIAPAEARERTVATGAAGTRLDALEERVDGMQDTLNEILQVLREKAHK